MAKRKYQVRVEEGKELIDQLFQTIAGLSRTLTIDRANHHPCSPHERTNGTSTCVLNCTATDSYKLFKHIRSKLSLDGKIVRKMYDDDPPHFVSLSSPVLPKLYAHVSMWMDSKDKQVIATINWQPALD